MDTRLRKLSWALTALVAVGLLSACGGSDLKCGENTEKSNGKCVPTDSAGLQCGNGTMAKDGQCVIGDDGCKPGTTLENGTCVPESEALCADGTEWDMAKKTCVAVATCGDQTTNENGKCVPEFSAICDAEMGAVTVKDGKCVVDFDSACAEGTKNAQGKCVPSEKACGDKATFDEDSGVCLPEQTCKQGDVVSNGLCVSPAEKLADNENAVSASENDDPELGGSPTMISLKDDTSKNTIFKGTIEAPKDKDGDKKADQDRDYFKFSAKKGDWVKLSVQSTGLPGAFFTVHGPNGEWMRHAGFTSGAQARQVVIPMDGEYTVEVMPQSVASNNDIGPVGNDDWGYVGTLQKMDTPSPSTVDFTSKSASGSFPKLMDNYFEIGGFSSGDVVTFTVDAAGDNARGIFQVWNGSEIVTTKKNVSSGDTVQMIVPQTMSGDKLTLLMDWSTITGSATDFEVSAKAKTGVKNIGNIAAGGKKSANTGSLKTDKSKTYTFTASGGEVLEIQQVNKDKKEVEYELTDAVGNVVASDSSLPSYDDLGQYDGALGYYYTETGGSFALTITAGDDLKDLKVTVNSITPADLGSGKPGDTISKTSTTTLPEGRSVFYSVTFQEDVLLDLTLDWITPKESASDMYLHNSDYEEVTGESGGFSGDDKLSISADERDITPAGVYILRLEGDEKADKYKIDFNLRQPPPIEKEPNNSTATATPVAMDKEMLGEATSGNPDVYKVTLSSDLAADEVLMAQISGSLESDDYNCWLLDSSGKKLKELKDRDYGCTLLAGGLAKGDYFVKTEIADSSDIEYSLTVTKETATLDTEPNNMKGKATGLKDTTFTDGSAVLGTLDTSDTTDIYSFNLPGSVSGKQFTAALSELGPDTGAGIAWKIVDGSGNTVISSDGTAQKPAPMAGKYYLHVTGKTGDLKDEDGEYRVNLGVVSQKSITKMPGKTIKDNVKSGVTSTGQVSGCGTVIGIEAIMTIDHHQGGDLTIELSNPAGKTIALANGSFGFSPYGDSNMQTNYPKDESPEDSFSNLYGKSGSGKWKVRVADVDGGSSDKDGTFKKWKLNLKCL